MDVLKGKIAWSGVTHHQPFTQYDSNVSRTRQFRVSALTLDTAVFCTSVKKAADTSDEGGGF